ncbi:hypothetical protein BpHYR1_004484 [Brachionus plicatilis]|uniref:Uncharacterized protein n=1 Tax=Brachionus plicatilis TaxID=10195 RepID=A0A3M7S9K6_BRAPC|nr:hypothetical protein BpHYR1_004484 [Brachionus plicatilis]
MKSRLAKCEVYSKQFEAKIPSVSAKFFPKKIMFILKLHYKRLKYRRSANNCEIFTSYKDYTIKRNEISSKISINVIFKKHFANYKLVKIENVLSRHIMTAKLKSTRI